MTDAEILRRACELRGHFTTQEILDDACGMDGAKAASLIMPDLFPEEAARIKE